MSTYNTMRADQVAEDLAKECGVGPLIGQKIFIRTVTYFWVGKCVGFTGRLIILEDASWIGQTGRWSEMLADGLEAQSSAEIEPTGTAWVSWGAVVDVCPYPHPLPNTSK